MARVLYGSLDVKSYLLFVYIWTVELNTSTISRRTWWHSLSLPSWWSRKLLILRKSFVDWNPCQNSKSANTPSPPINPSGWSVSLATYFQSRLMYTLSMHLSVRVSCTTQEKISQMEYFGPNPRPWSPTCSVLRRVYLTSFRLLTLRREVPTSHSRDTPFRPLLWPLHPSSGLKLPNFITVKISVIFPLLPHLPKLSINPSSPSSWLNYILTG